MIWLFEIIADRSRYKFGRKLALFTWLGTLFFYDHGKWSWGFRRNVLNEQQIEHRLGVPSKYESCQLTKLKSLIIFIDSKYFLVFFHPLTWTRRPKKFSSAIGAYGCQLGFVLVLWLPHFCNLLLFCVGTMWKNNYYLFIMPWVFLVHYMYITDPILGLVCFCSLLRQFVLQL